MGASLLSHVNLEAVIATEQRRESITWAEHVLNEPNVVFLDTETTGLDENAEIVDIAIIDRHGTVLLDTLVQPQGTVPAEAAAIHGISDAMLVDAPTWPEVYPLLGRVLDRYGPVVIYNAEFDSRVINQVNARHGLPALNADWQCAMRQYAAFAGIWHPTYNNFRWHKLTDAVRMMNLPAMSAAHRALEDAVATRRLVEAMASSVQHTEAVNPQPLPTPLGGTDDWRDGAQTRDFPGGRVTVITGQTRGCSLTLLIVIGIILVACGIMACIWLFMLSFDRV